MPGQERIETEIFEAVTDSLVSMYDRYMVIAIGITVSPAPIMSFNDFVNQLLVRGMVEYNVQLLELEKEIEQFKDEKTADGE